LIPLTALALVFGVQLGLYKLGIIPETTKKINAVHMFIIIVSQAGIFLTLVMLLQAKLGFKYFGLGDEITGKDLIFGFAGLIIVNIFSSIFLNLTGTVPDQFKGFSPELLRNNIFLFMFTVALLGPIYEEVIFRGFILGMLVPEQETLNNNSPIKKNLPAILFTSLIFMLAHFDNLIENYYIGLPLFLLGMYFSFITIYKKGIMLGILLHISQNFLAGIMMLYQAKQL